VRFAVLCLLGGGAKILARRLGGHGADAAEVPTAESVTLSRVLRHDWSPSPEREFVIDNLLVRIHFIIVMIRWTGLAPREVEFPFPGSLASTFLLALELFLIIALREDPECLVKA